MSAGPGRDPDTNVREWNGRGRVSSSNGRAWDSITCPVQHSNAQLSGIQHEL